MFTIDSHYNPYLGTGKNTLRMVLSLNVPDNVQIPAAPLALAIVIDISNSMFGKNIRAAREGAARIVQLLDPGITFMLVTFSRKARTIYGPVPGTEEHKKKALREIQRIGVEGGTRMSTALNEVVTAFKPYQQQARMMLFLTDGQNLEEKQVLHQAVDQCVDTQISIHAWGIGADWDATELRYMAEMTHGSADIIPTPDKLEAAFLHAFQRIRRTALTDVRLLLWTPAEVVIQKIQRVFPTIVALNHQTDTTNQRQQVIALGSFAANDKHDYLIELFLPPHDPGQRFMMLRPSLRYNSAGGEQEERAPRESWVAVEWTQDITLATRIDSHIAHYTNEQELAEYIQQGNEALQQGNKERAATLLMQALEVSRRTGNEQIAELLSTMVTRGTDGRPQIKTVDAIIRKTLEIKQGSTSRLN